MDGSIRPHANQKGKELKMKPEANPLLCILLKAYNTYNMA